MTEVRRDAVPILRESTSVTTGIEVTEKLIHASRSLASILRGTLGPKGLDKGLYKGDGQMTITGDGARVLSDLLIKNPGAKLLVSLGKSQESSIGDGVTSTVLFCGALLDEAGRLLRRGVHPLTITDGYQVAAEIALNHLEHSALILTDMGGGELVKVAATALSGRSVGGDPHIARMLVDAAKQTTSLVDEQVRSDAEDVLFDKLGEGGIGDTTLVRGVHWRHRIPIERMAGVREDVSVAILNAPLTIREGKWSSEIELQSAEALTGFMDAQKQQYAAIAEQVMASGADIICTSGEVEKSVLHLLAAADKVVLSDIDHSQLKNLARASGGRIVDHISDLSRADLGEVGRFEAERRKATDEVQDRIIFDGCSGPLVTILVGGTVTTEESIRAMYDALRAVTLTISDGRILHGGGASHMAAASAVYTAAESVADRTRLAMEAYARALELYPWMLAANTGVNPLDALLDLKAARSGSDDPIGIKADGSIGTMEEVLEPAESLLNGISTATETAMTLIRCDQVISARGD